MITRREILGAAVALPLLPAMLNQQAYIMPWGKFIKTAIEQNIVCYDHLGEPGIITNRLMSIIWTIGMRNWKIKYDYFILEGDSISNKTKWVENCVFVYRYPFYRTISRFTEKLTIPKDINKKYYGLAVDSKTHKSLMFVY